MSVIIILISVSFLIALTFLLLFVWSVKSEQYEDTDGPPVRILFEDGKEEKPPSDAPR